MPPPCTAVGGALAMKPTWSGTFKALARCVSVRWPYSPLRHFRDNAPAGLLSPNSRTTSQLCEARRRSSPTRQCLCLPQPASSQASHRAPLGARQRFWVCIASGLPPVRDSAYSYKTLVETATQPLENVGAHGHVSKPTTPS